MKQITLNDFSGGIAADGTVVSPRQVTSAIGFVLDDQRRMRSQPAIERVGTLESDSIEMLAKFVCEDRTWLIAVASNVTWYALMPEPTTNAVYGTGTYEATWSQLATPGGDLRPVLQYRKLKNDRYVPAFLVAQQPYRAVTQQGRAAYILTENAAGTALEVEASTKFFPGATYVGEAFTPTAGVTPCARVGCMWGDVAVYADIEYAQGFVVNKTGTSTAMTTSNVKRRSNYLYLGGQNGDPSTVWPYPVRAAEEGAEITGVYQVEEGLLVFTTSSSGVSGVVLLRGTAADFVAGNGRIDKVSGIPPKGRQAYWDEQMSVLFVTEDNRVMQYRSGRFADLSPYSAALPSQAEANEITTSSVAACGRYVVFGDGDQKTAWIMRSYGSEGAWTQLRLPDDVTIVWDSFLEASNDIVFLVKKSNGQVFPCVLRVGSANYGSVPTASIQMGGGGNGVFPPPRPFTGRQALRGQVLGEFPDLVLVSRPLGEETTFGEKWWDKVGVRVQRGSASGGVVKALGSQGTSPDEQEPDVYVVALNETIPTHPVQHAVPSLGPCPQLRVAVTCAGDVIVEQLVIWFNPGSEAL